MSEREKSVVRGGGGEGWGACHQSRQEKKARWLWESRLFFCRDGIFSVINRLESGPSEARRTTPRRGQFALLQEPLRDGEKGEEKGNYGIFYRRDKAPHPFKGLRWNFQSRGRASEIKTKKNTRERRG